MRFLEKRKCRAEAGVTLIELLIVVAIIGLIAIFLTVAVARTIRRQRVAAAAQEIRMDLQACYTRVMTTQQPVYVRIDLPNRHVDIMADELGATLYQQYVIPSDISLSTADVTAVECIWPIVNGFPMLMCDYMGRAIDPTTGFQVATSQTLVVTHADMVLGTLKPRMKYTVTVFPLWNSEAIVAKY
jgi:prepilin-type N-terminal cleavage/methylation domain-containing protein